MQQTGKVVYVNGPIVRADGAQALHMYELVLVGEARLTGEVISLSGDHATVQVYEETSGLRPGEPVFASGGPLCAELGPGLIESMFDGILRPLRGLERATGSFIGRGARVPSLDRSRFWQVAMKVKAGDEVRPGQVVAEVQETELFCHRVLAPPDVQGKIVDAVADGAYTVDQTLARVTCPDGKERTIGLCQKWPVRRPRPVTAQAAAQQAADHRPARHRHVLPDRQGRHRRHPGRLRHRQDRDPAPARQVVPTPTSSSTSAAASAATR